MLYSNAQESRCCDRCFQLRQAFRGVTVQQTGSVSLSLSLVSLTTDRWWGKDRSQGRTRSENGSEVSSSILEVFSYDAVVKGILRLYHG